MAGAISSACRCFWLKRVFYLRKLRAYVTVKKNRETSILFLCERNVTSENGYVPVGAGVSRSPFKIRVNVAPLFTVLP